MNDNYHYGDNIIKGAHILQLQITNYAFIKKKIKILRLITSSNACLYKNKATTLLTGIFCFPFLLKRGYYCAVNGS